MEFSNTKKISTKPPSCEASSHNAALQDEDQLDHAELWRSSVGRSLSAQPLVGFAVQQSSVKFAERSIVPAVAPWEGMETSVSRFRSSASSAMRPMVPVKSSFAA